MKKYVLFAFIALFYVSSSAWAQYVKVTAEDGTESWIEIEGIINGTNIEIYGGLFVPAIDKNTKGSIDLNEVWSRSGGRGTNYQVTSIGNCAFLNCSGLTSITIPNSVTSIKQEAFAHCTGLTSIKNPSSVTYIEGWVSSGCINLTVIVVESGNTVYDSRGNCNAIIETASNTLITGCKNTKIPNSVTSIGKTSFPYCTGLTSIEIPNSVTDIGESVFAMCTGLTSITIPNSVTSIGLAAFSGCSGLISITSYITEVFETGRNSFIGCENATLYVPKGLVSTYRSTVDWDLFNKIEEIPGIALAMSCNNKGKVTVNGGIQFTNDMGEVSVYDGMDNSFIFQPKENCELRQVLIDGLDVTVSVENNQLTTKVHEGSKMMVIFDKTGYDVNGDGNVDISDVVKLVNFILGQ
ncbi:MAG: leucine-rich repeat protein [Bacteroidaceae bacterium]|nr:leucine-rich repeat protein [Bacteroidaceae bacterium]